MRYLEKWKTPKHLGEEEKAQWTWVTSIFEDNVRKAARRI
jgi:hypothetical protein